MSRPPFSSSLSCKVFTNDLDLAAAAIPVTSYKLIHKVKNDDFNYKENADYYLL